MTLARHPLLLSTALAAAACVSTAEDTGADDTDPADTLGEDTGSAAALRPEQAEPGWLSVAEVLRTSTACPAVDGWIELRWSPPGSERLALEGLVIAGTRNSAVLAGDAVLVAGARLVLTPSADAYRACYGLDADLEVDLLVSDTVTLSDGQRVLDEAVLGVDTPGAARSRDDAGAWCLATTPLGDGDLGTPGAANPDCARDTDSDPHTDADTDLPPDTDTDTDTDPPPRAVADLSAGELQITEFMSDPGDVDDRVGEYIELHYTGAGPLDVFGLEVSDATTRWTVPTHVVLASGERLLVARDAAGLSAAYGVTGDVSSGLSLNNDGGDQIRVGPVTAPLDAVDYRTWRTVRGAAWERDPAAPTRWCVATDPIGTTTDRGTPGRTNRSCSGGGVDTGETDVDTDAVRDVSTLVPGELRVVELMANPFQCTDPSGEYIEVLLRVDSEPVDVFGLQLGTQSGARTTIREHVVASPGVPLALLHSSACYTASGAPYSGVQLVNSGGLVTLSEGGRLLDEVAYGAVAGAAGVAWQQDVSGVWCAATDLIPGSVTDHGSPGSLNPSCTPDDDSDSASADTAETDAVMLHLEDIPLGLLRISEVLANPAVCPDERGEFVELFWSGERTLDVQGLVLFNAAGSSATVSGSFLVQPRTHVLLHRASPCGTYSGIVVSGPDLDNVQEVVRIRDAAGRQLDEVTLAPHVLVTGVAWQRDDDRPAYTCAATLTVPGTIDRGTPGAPNTPCQATPPPDTDVVTDTDTDTDGALPDTGFVPSDTADTP